MFVGWERAYCSEAHFRCSSLGKAPGLNHKHQTRWEGLPGTNALAYYEYLQLTAVKKFVGLRVGQLGEESMVEKEGN